jgi:hypothetical protein
MTAESPPFQIVGLMNAPASGGVLLMQAETGTAVFLAIGEARDGWTLRSVNDRTAHFTSDAGVEADLALPLPGNMFDGAVHVGSDSAPASAPGSIDGVEGTGGDNQDGAQQ